LGIETKGYKKAKDSRDEIHGTHSRIQFIRPQKKWESKTRTPIVKPVAQRSADSYYGSS
jgi:hypothetical protein